MTESKRRVALIGTGGTSSSIGRGPLDLWEYMDAGRKAEPDELLVRFPETAEAAEIVSVRFRAVSSAAIGPREWLELDAAVHAAVAREAPLDGVVITHGTATLEETAYFLNLTLTVDTTVVVVGSQRPASGLSSDAGLPRGEQDVDAPARDLSQPGSGHARVRGSRRARRHLPAAGAAAHDGDGVRRARPDRAAARGHRDVVRGRGRCGDPRVRRRRRPRHRLGLAPARRPDAGRSDALGEARRRGVLVVLSSRAGSGRVLPRTSLREQGFVVADNLNPQKARVLAMLALTRTGDVADVQRMFDEY